MAIAFVILVESVVLVSVVLVVECIHLFSFFQSSSITWNLTVFANFCSLNFVFSPLVRPERRLLVQFVNFAVHELEQVEQLVVLPPVRSRTQHQVVVVHQEVIDSLNSGQMLFGQPYLIPALVTNTFLL